MTTILVPYRADGKSRFELEERQVVAQAMLRDVLAACAEVGDATVVDRPGGLGNAVGQALAALPAGPVLVVNADLPCVRPCDLEALLAAVPEGGFALAPARDRTTNALALAGPALFRSAYGPRSADRFRALGGHELELPNLRDDVDSFSDLEQLEDRVGPETRRALDRLRVAPGR